MAELNPLLAAKLSVLGTALSLVTAGYLYFFKPDLRRLVPLQLVAALAFAIMAAMIWLYVHGASVPVDIIFLVVSIGLLIVFLRIVKRTWRY